MSFVSLKRLSVRWALVFLGIYLSCSALLFALLYFFLVHIFEQKDREVTTASARHFSTVLESGGPEALAREIKDRTSQLERDQLIVRYQSGDQVRIFNLPSDFNEYDPAQMEKRLQEAAARASGDSELSFVSPRDSEDIIELEQMKVAGGVLQVGRNTEDREALLGEFRRGFFAILALGVALGGIASWAFARESLKPIQALIRTLRSLRAGTIQVRAAEVTRKDELGKLTQLFNEMLDQNEKLNQGLRDSLDFVAHDLRTPMTRFRTRAELALASSQSEKWREALHEALEESAEVVTLLNGLLETTQAEAGTLTLRKESIPVRQLLESIQDLYSLIAEDRDQKIEIEIQGEPTIEVDARFKQVIANLLDNAIKFAPTSSVVTLAAFETATETVIEVRDQGPGIASHERERIWQRLYRGDASRSTQGLGLGLNLVQALTRAHGGRVEVKSTQGACFRVLIPRLVFGV